MEFVADELKDNTFMSKGGASFSRNITMYTISSLEYLQFHYHKLRWKRSRSLERSKNHSSLKITRLPVQMSSISVSPPGNSTGDDDPMTDTAFIDATMVLFLPFILIPTSILVARLVKYIWRIYQAKKYGFGSLILLI